MPRTTIWLRLALLSLFAAAPALAQPELDDDFDDPLAGDEVELADDDLFSSYDDDAPAGAEENPDAPRRRAGADAELAAAADRAAYPLELAARPLALPAGMSEVALDLPVHVDPFVGAGLLRGSYGVDTRIQAGLRYGLGAFDEDGFTAGKTVALDGLYVLRDFVAVQVSIPVLLDPLAAGLTIGAPMKFRFDGWALTFGRDLLNFKLRRFMPVVENALATDALAELHRVGTILPDRDLRLLGGVIYQLRPNLALTGETGIIVPNFFGGDPTQNSGVPLQATLTHSSSNTLDLGARIGFGDLNETASFAVSLVAALRI
jgi:hypothetical protein